MVAQLRRARKREPPLEAKAMNARYLPKIGAVEVTLARGVVVTIPVTLLPELKNASEDILADVHVSPGGWGVCWDRADVQYEVGGVLALAGWPRPAAAMRELGRIGGRTKSPARARASRANGAKGGRPRKQRPG
jgi:SLT domain-containing protein